MLKRISLFLLVNFLVVISVSVILNLFHVQPFLRSYGLDMRSLLIFCLAWGMGGAFVSLALSRMTAKWMLGVQLVDSSCSHPTYQKIYHLVERLSMQAGLTTTPQVGIFHSPTPNAFATGPTKNKSLVAVSTGLIEKMTLPELEAIIGHEITHITNGDMVTMTLLQGIINAFVMFLARVLAFALSSVSKDSKESRSSFSYGSYYLMVFLFEMVFMVLGSLIVCAYSRRREYRADLGGARLSSFNHMISALKSLDKAITYEKEPKAPALEAFMIKPMKKSVLSKLFSTHPSIEERCERLKKAQLSM